MKPYISIDLETTGIEPDDCQILEVGAVIDDLISPIESCPVFHTYVVHPQYKGEAYALSMHPKILRRIATREPGFRYMPADEVCGALADFARQHDLDREHLLASGKNFGSFDLQFLKKLPYYKVFLGFKHRFLDPGMLYWEPTDDEPPNTKTCLERAGLPSDVKHEAVEDAKEIVQLVRIAWERRCQEIRRRQEIAA